jgi:4-diphosphocytidyl-2-C-methyl-D-erythritol kinase
MNSAPWPAPAKINLFLHVTGRRPDGYHLLQTQFQFLDYGDELAITVREDGQITRATDLAGVPAEQDLVVRAARALKEASGCPLGADIGVTKRIPMGGGLGGGSSDAATVLRALDHLWQTRLGVDRLAEIGLALGADVPVFVRGLAAFAEGVGERLVPLDAEESWALVIHPGCEVPTGMVFGDPALTRNTPPIKIPHLLSSHTHNDCEPVTRRLFPVVDEALAWLEKFAPARMSGTGACIFASFPTEAEAREVGRQVPRGWHWFAARRANRSPLLARLGEGA